MSKDKKIVIFLSGRGSNCKAILDAVKNQEIPAEVVALVSDSDAPGLQYAEGIETVVSSDFKMLAEKFCDVDLIVLAGYLKILPLSFVRQFEHRIINIHPSLIPSFCGKGYYGIRVHEEVLKRGVKVTGVTTHFVTEVPDGGPILMQRAVEVKETDTPDLLASRVLEVEHEILVETVRRFCKGDFLMKNVMVIGRGGREYAIAKKLSESRHVKKVYCVPGNGGMEEFCETVALDITDFPALIDFAKQKTVDLTVVGPENSLCEGIVDAFQKEGLKIFGPNQKCAELEKSKNVTKEFLIRNQIPTAKFQTIHEYEKAISYLSEIQYPIVIKADGLALGKGVEICPDESRAKEVIHSFLVDHQYGTDTIVIEEFLQGREISSITFVSHNRIFPLLYARDYKKIGENDTGANTGGVGCQCPVPDVTEQEDQQMKDALKKIEKGLQRDGYDYTGILFVGFMLTEQANVLEFNVRFGDPETQAILSLLQSDLYTLMEKTIDGTISEEDFQWEDRQVVGIVATSGGYPKNYEKGKEIKGLSDLEDDVILIHHATKKVGGKYLTNGGRVLMVLAKGDDLQSAREKAYRNLEKISFEKMYYRKDIGYESTNFRI